MKSVLPLIVLLLLLPARAASAPPQLDRGRWTSLAPLPVPAQEVGVGVVRKRVYVLGGSTTTGPTSAVWAYDPATNVWSRPGAVAPLPGPPRDHIGVAATGGKLYAIGGLTRGWTRISSSVYAYDPARNAWRRMANIPDPGARGSGSRLGRAAMGVAAIDGKLYVAGGLSRTSSGAIVAVRAFERFDPATNRWTRLPNMSTTRDHLVAVALGRKFYAVGGRNVSITAATGANEVFNPETNRWGALAPLPVQRGGLGAGTLGGKIVVFGGEGNGPSHGTWPNTEAYDPTSNRWQELASMPTSRHGIGGAALGGRVYVPGGATWQGGGHPSGANEAFTFLRSSRTSSDATAQPIPR